MRVTLNLTDDDGVLLGQHRFPDGVTPGVVMSLLESGAWSLGRMGSCDECGHFFRKDELAPYPDADDADSDWLCPTCRAEREAKRTD